MDENMKLILAELQKLNSRVDTIEANMTTKDDIANMASKSDIANMATKENIVDLAAKMATKDDIADLPFIRQAVLETNANVKFLMENQRIIFERLDKHDVAIYTLTEQTAKLMKVIRV